jgi:hypothetical protein
MPNSGENFILNAFRSCEVDFPEPAMGAIVPERTAAPASIPFLKKVRRSIAAFWFVKNSAR